MHLRLRFIGKALDYLNARGHDERRLVVQVSPEVIQVGDLVRHPLFPGRNVYVVAREVDFVDRCVNVWLDELPGASPDAESSSAAALPCAQSRDPSDVIAMTAGPEEIRAGLQD